MATAARICEDLEEVASEKPTSHAATESRMREDHKEAVDKTSASDMANTRTVDQTPDSVNADAAIGDPRVKDASKASRAVEGRKTKSKKGKKPKAEVSDDPKFDFTGWSDEQLRARASARVVDDGPSAEDMLDLVDAMDRLRL